MSPKANLQESDDGRLAVHGNLTLDTVADLYRDSLGMARREHLPAVIDLAGVDRVDSSGLALLLEWQSWALAHDHCFEFINTPAHLMQLARLSETKKLLELKDCEDKKTA